MKKKLIVEIAEGLGNQMFMYAHAYALAKFLNYELLIDNSSAYSKKKNLLRKHSKYMLNFFSFDQFFCSDSLKYDSNYKRLKKKIEIILDKFYFKKKFLIEKNIKYKNKKVAQSLKIPKKNKLSNLCYVQGNFENYNYFKKYHKDLVNMFKPKKSLLMDNNKIINYLKNTNSISIHIRRHKFTEQPHELINANNINQTENFTNELFNYIKKSVIYFENKLKDPVFFIWSNDFNGIEKIFSKKKFIFIEGNDAINDFHLFSYAKHFIVGGSSFHWWGAWLNTNSNKICLRPSNLNPSNNLNFYPKEWIEI